MWVLLSFGVPRVAASGPLLPAGGSRVPAAVGEGILDTVLPAAAGGLSPYSYPLTGLPSEIGFPCPRGQLRGRLPAVEAEKTCTATYSVTDRTGARKSVTFAVTVAARPSDRSRLADRPEPASSSRFGRDSFAAWRGSQGPWR